MSAKLKVYNDRGHDIGVILLNGQHLNIHAHSFVLLSEDDIAYIDSRCAYDKKLFASGKLRIGDGNPEELENIGIPPAYENTIPSRDEIEKKLGMSAAKVKDWLGEISDEAILFEIYGIAKEMDLSASKMRAIESILPESLTIDDNEE